MHNGGIGGFQKLKRKIRRKLSDEIYDWVRGQTDSEHLFGLVLENLKEYGAQPSSQQMTAALEKTIREIEEMKAAEGITEASYINCTLTDGTSIVAARYVSDLSEAASTLYYSQGHHYVCVDGNSKIVPSSKGETAQAVIIVSEKLTERSEDWVEIPTNHFFVVDEKMKAILAPINDGIARAAAKAESSDSKKKKSFQPKRVA